MCDPTHLIETCVWYVAEVHEKQVDVYGQPEHGEHQHDDDEREAGLSLPVGLTTSLAHSDRRLVVAARQHRRHCRHRSRQRGTVTRYVT